MMSDMHADDLTPAERRTEIVALLARGYLRLCAGAKDSAVNREESLEAPPAKSVYAPTKESRK